VDAPIDESEPEVKEQAVGEREEEPAAIPTPRNIFVVQEHSDPTGTEEIARRLIESRFSTGGGNGNGSGNRNGSSQSQPEGEFSLDSPLTPTPPNTTRLSITVPASFHIIHQYFKSEGWEGSMDDLVAEIVLCHFNECMGKAIVVVDRQEFGIKEEVCVGA